MKNIILFGDSIMAGFQDGMPTDIITNSLQKNFPNYKIKNHSVPGCTTEEALDFLSIRCPKDSYDLVVLAMGTNDACVNIGLNAGRYARNLQQLVDQIGKDQLILVGPSYTNWKIALDHSWPKTLQFELVAKEAARRNQLPFLDLAKAMRSTHYPNELLQEDGIHLNQEGNQLLIDNLTTLIKQKIE